MMATANQIADWLVEYCTTNGAPIDAMSLEKHLYYAQGFHFARTGMCLFADRMEAWTYGPVVRSVWDRYGKNRDGIVDAKNDPPVLDLELSSFLADVVGLLSPIPAMELSRATHKEQPWSAAFHRPKAHPYDNNEITVDALCSWFVPLIQEGEEALSSHALLDVIGSPDWGWHYIAGICARQMRDHPFFIRGMQLWNSRLWERPVADEIPEAAYRTPSRAERKDRVTVETADDLKALLS